MRDMDAWLTTWREKWEIRVSSLLLCDFCESKSNITRHPEWQKDHFSLLSRMQCKWHIHKISRWWLLTRWGVSKCAFLWELKNVQSVGNNLHSRERPTASDMKDDKFRIIRQRNLLLFPSLLQACHLHLHHLQIFLCDALIVVIISCQLFHTFYARRGCPLFLTVPTFIPQFLFRENFIEGEVVSFIVSSCLFHCSLHTPCLIPPMAVTPFHTVETECRSPLPFHLPSRTFFTRNITVLFLPLIFYLSSPLTFPMRFVSFLLPSFLWQITWSVTNYAHIAEQEGFERRLECQQQTDNTYVSLHQKDKQKQLIFLIFSKTHTVFFSPSVSILTPRDLSSFIWTVCIHPFFFNSHLCFISYLMMGEMKQEDKNGNRTHWIGKVRWRRN